MRSTMVAAIGKWRGILQHFGVADEYLSGKHGPCPFCGGRDRWRFTDKDGAGMFICSQCGSGDGMDLLIRFTGRDFKDLAKEIDGIVGNVEYAKPKQFDAEKAQNRIRGIIRSASSTDSINPVRLYLKKRGLPFCNALRYIPEMELYQSGARSVHPAMLALLSDREGKCTGVHITHLTQSGEKADVEPQKKILKAVDTITGSAIRLTPVYEHIGIAEGIETALAVMRDFKLPCWAAFSAHMLESFVVPEGVKKISIFADNDRSFTGQRAAYILANRLHQKYDIEVIVPDRVGDFADTREAT